MPVSSKNMAVSWVFAHKRHMHVQTYVLRLFKALGFSVAAKNLLRDVYVLSVSLPVC